MGTEVSQLKSPTDPEATGKGVMTIKNGSLVAFPTETVYDLGANGLDPKAMVRIYEAKRQPNDNPMILHTSNQKMLEDLVREIPREVKDYIDIFWPGPLTIIFYKKDLIPDKVCAGLNTMAIRIPSGPFARTLIEASGVLITAPLANMSGRPSSTKTTHVLKDMAGEIELIADGGSTQMGIESTVLDMTVDSPMLLWPGSVALEDLEELSENINVDSTLLGDKPKEVLHLKSPGQEYRHYASKADCLLFAGNLTSVAKEVSKRIRENLNKKITVLTMEETINLYTERPYLLINMESREHMEETARDIFNSSREYDEEDVDLIFVEGLSLQGMGQRIMSRLLKTYGGKVVLGF